MKQKSKPSLRALAKQSSFVLLAFWIASLTLAMTTFLNPAHAACSSPTGGPGDTIFNDSYKVLQYCNDTSWVPMAPHYYWPNAVRVDSGIPTYLTLSSSMAGIVDGKTATASLWFRRASFSGEQRIYSNSVPGTPRFIVGLDGSNRFQVVARNSADTVILTMRTLAISDTNWHHALISFDLSDPAKRHIYIDGVNAFNAAPTYTNDIIPFSATTTHQISHNSTPKYNGDIADLWVDMNTYVDFSDATNRAKFINAAGKPVYLGADGSLPLGAKPDVFLSGATSSWETNKGTGGGFTETGALTDSTSSPSDNSLNVPAVGHWKLDENSGTSAADSSANGLTGTLQNSPLWVTGRTGSALDFITNQYVSVPYNAALALSLPITLSAWVNLDPGGQGWVIATNGGAGSYTGAYMHVSGSSVFAQYGNNTSGAAGGRRTGTANVTVPSGTWTHVAVVINGATNMIVYVNGVDAGALTYSGSGGTIAYDVAKPLMIGYGHTNNGVYFEGAIDDARVYGAALTAAQVAELALGCSSPLAPAGAVEYDGDRHVMTFCNGRNWITMGPNGNGGAGCTSPSGGAGDLIYNGTAKVMQYCEGDEWILIGGCTLTPGSPCPDNTIYAGLSPDGNVPMFTTRCDIGQSWNGTSCTGTRSLLTFNNGACCGNQLHIAGATNGNTGEANTAHLITQDSDGGNGGTQPHIAAQTCSDLVADGNSDWYLPATNELAVLNANKIAIGSFNLTSESYWSSTDAGSSYDATQIDFSNGSGSGVPKDYQNNIRCVRK